MKQTYEYMHITTAMDSICVEDIGECALQEFNDEGDQWFLVITTFLGRSKIIEFGPIRDGEIQDNFYLSRKNIEYRETSLDKIIQKFIENPHRMITQVEIVDEELVINALDTIKEQIN